jgi:hypothetical protein
MRGARDACTTVTARWKRAGNFDPVAVHYSRFALIGEYRMYFWVIPS